MSNKWDQDFHDTFKALLYSGIDNSQIARALNAKGYRLPRNGQKWVRESVRKYRTRHFQRRYDDPGDDCLFQNGTMPAVVDDFYPFILPVRTDSDFYCRVPPGPRRYGRNR